MLKKRLIFTLLIQNGIFQLSRNFSLQSVGDINWLYNSYHFNSIAHSIDELILLNVEREQKKVKNFTPTIIEMSKKCFMPIAAGGGIDSLEDAYQILDGGADKLVINTALFRQPELIRKLVKIFGSQCVVASIDYRKVGAKKEVFISNGAMSTGKTVEEAVKTVEDLGVGEIYLTSIDKDGTGQGYDIETLKKVVSISQLPVIASGGVGDFEHLVIGMNIENITGTSTANIFNFIGNGLTESRCYIQQRGIPLATWNFDSLIITT